MFNVEKLINARIKISELEKENIQLRNEKNEIKENLKAEHEKKLEEVKKDNAAEVARNKANEDVRLMEATTELKKENGTLSNEKAVLAGKVEMYEKAFENLGFDVKDMKEILNKLVDGLVAKNEIKLVTAK